MTEIEAFRAVIARLLKRVAKLESPWIKVGDRLPEVKKSDDFRDNWFICRTADGHKIPLSMEDWNGKPAWHGYGGNSGCFPSDEIITEWMEIPE